MIDMQTKANNQTWNFQNSYLKLPTKLYMEQLPITVKKPQIVYYNMKLEEELGLQFLSEERNAIAEYFSGNKIPVNISCEKSF